MDPDKITDFEEPEWIFPYQWMQVGESFFVPTLRPAYMHYIIDTTAKRAEVQVKCYTMVDEGVLGVRAWRIS
jgi:hypothetical protein